MPSKKPSNISSSKNKTNGLLDKVLNRTSLLVTILFGIFGVGFYVGEFKESLDAKVEKAQASEECNRQIEEARNQCRELQFQNTNQAVTDLKKLVEEHLKQKNEK